MKYYLLTLVFLISISTGLKAQVLALSISDSLAKPVLAAGVSINGVKKANYNGEVLFFDVKSGDKLRIESYFHEPFETHIKSSENLTDTLRLNVVLSDLDRSLETVVVSGDKIKVFYNIENSNVIDYYPYQGFSLFIVKEERKRFVQLNRNMKLLAKKELNFIPESIYLDGFGNFHLIAADSVYQIWFKEADIGLLEPISLKTFDTQVKPLIGKTDQSIFTQKYKSANKFYSIDNIKKDSVLQCYITYDRLAHKMAQIQENKIISKYYAAVASYENIIELGLWDGDLIQLQTFNDRTITDDIGWYKSALDNPIKCSAFGMENFIAVVDLYKDTVLIIDYHSNKVVKKSHLNNPCSGITTVYYDYFNDAVYLIDQTGKGVDIYILNPVNGVIQKMEGIYDIPFVENIKISGEWVYFEIRERTGFNKILRQRII